MKTVAILGPLDTKGGEFAFLKERLEGEGVKTLVLDCGVMGEPAFTADVTAEELARLGGSALASLQGAADRGDAIRVMGLGAREKLLALHKEGHIHGVVSAGGSGTTSVAATAMQGLPVGFPKLILSTMASGNVAPYVGIKDITMMFSVGDIEGVNTLTSLVLNNAAGAMAGMVKVAQPELETRPTIGLTMFGVTTPAAKAIRQRLEDEGFEVLVFHAVGTGGRAMETLVEQGIIQGLIDLTTTEIADEVVGGILSAGPDRLKAGVRCNVPQVIVPGALDMVNFGPEETVPERFSDRHLYVHNPQITLMRTTADENRQFAEFMATNLVGADPERVVILVPLKGISAIDQEGAVFYDPEADAAFREVLKTLLGDRLPIIELDLHINDEIFAEVVVRRFISIRQVRNLRL